MSGGESGAREHAWRLADVIAQWYEDSKPTAETASASYVKTAQALQPAIDKVVEMLRQMVDANIVTEIKPGQREAMARIAAISRRVTAYPSPLPENYREVEVEARAHVPRTS
jgi:hypothetical protein